MDIEAMTFQQFKDVLYNPNVRGFCIRGDKGEGPRHYGYLFTSNKDRIKLITDEHVIYDIESKDNDKITNLYRGTLYLTDSFGDEIAFTFLIEADRTNIKEMMK